LVRQPQADGGLGLLLKLIQERMGHTSVVMTSDVYATCFLLVMMVRKWLP
jgi:integrase